MERKAFEKSINVVITIVVLLVVALALITLVLNQVVDTENNVKPTTDDAACNIWKRTACGLGEIGTKTHPNIAGCEIECNTLS